MITHAFIIGASRSGTSVLAQALGRNRQIVATEELHYYNLLKPNEETAGGRRGLLALLWSIEEEKRFFEIKNDLGAAHDVPDEAIAEMDSYVPAIRAFLDWCARRASAAAVVEQTPMNLYYRDAIRGDFPNPVFVLVRRDPRAILASQKHRWKVGLHGARHIPARDIARVRHAGHPLIQLALLRATRHKIRAAEMEPDVVCVCYEDLVREPERILSTVCERLGVPFDPGMLEVSDAGSSHASERGRTGFDASRLNTWRSRLDATEIWLVERFCRDSLVLAPTGARPSALALLRLIASLPISLILALYYSVRSYGNPIEAARRRLM